MEHRVSQPGPPPRTANSCLHSLDVSGAFLAGRKWGVTAASPRRRREWKASYRGSLSPGSVPPAHSCAPSWDLCSVAQLLTFYTVTHGPDFIPIPREEVGEQGSSSLDGDGCHSRRGATAPRGHRCVWGSMRALCRRQKDPGGWT